MCITYPATFNRRPLTLILLYEEVFNLQSLRCTQNAVPIDCAVSNFGEVFGSFVKFLGWRESALAIFKMEHAHPFAKLLQHRDRILAGLRNPVAVHFEADQFGIGILGQDIEAGDTAQPAELVIV